MLERSVLKEIGLKYDKSSAQVVLRKLEECGVGVVTDGLSLTAY